MIGILYSRTSGKTGRNLAALLGFKCGKNISLLEECDKIVNWGNTTYSDYSGRYIINTKDAVAESSSKGYALFKMQKHGVCVPKTYTPKEAIDLCSKSDDINLIGRKERHFSGSGFWECVNKIDIMNASSGGATHFLQKINKIAEYRVHIFANNLIKISKKTKGDPEKVLWNHKNGWVFYNLYNVGEKEKISRIRDSHERMILLAKRAIELFKLDFGAVDIMYDGDEYYVLEINSAPALAGSGLSAYARAIKSIT